MLNNPDTDVVREWLNRALEGADAKGKRAALAHHCGVRPQAVSGWLRTGRITKKNLEQASVFFGHSPSFTRVGLLATERRPGHAYVDLPAGLTTAERDLVLAYRVLPKRRQVALLAEFMAEAQQQLADMHELNARTGAKGTVSPARAAETLPVRPDGEQPDTVPGRL